MFNLDDFSFLSLHDIWVFGTVLLCLLVMVDDMYIDFLAYFMGLGPKQISKSQFDKMNALDQKRIAVLIANWNESGVLERMVAGNLKNIDYQNYEIILGVYPNDHKTMAAARKAQAKSRNVRVYVNSVDGPTSKGQLLNEMVKYIDEYHRAEKNRPYDLIVTHDAEDMIHKYSLKLINFLSLDYDFIQIPVLSLPTPLSKLTAGIYLDEFTDSHTKNLLVRDHYHAGIPSAGVGTAVSRNVVAKLLKLQNGHFLNEQTLTEDYFLGLTCYDLNIKAHFAAEFLEYTDKATGQIKRDYVATREYFPQTILASIKQKTRWIMGICLQSYEQEKRKSKSAMGAYFLWKDRKGLWCAPLFVSCVVFTVYFVGTYFATGRWPQLDHKPWSTLFISLMWTNLGVSVFRILLRVALVQRLYGMGLASLVPVRWVLSNFINNAATFNAVYLWTKSKIMKEMPKWAKTDHIIMEGFGEEPQITVMALPKRKLTVVEPLQNIPKLPELPKMPELRA